jgi:hypothetical protein
MNALGRSFAFEMMRHNNRRMLAASEFFQLREELRYGVRAVLIPFLKLTRWINDEQFYVDVRQAF